MGNIFSNHFIHHKPLESQDFTSYEAACREDEDVRRVDTNLKAKTGKVLSKFAGGSQPSLSFGLLTEVTTSLSELDWIVLEVILDCKDDVWKDKDLFPLVKDFFNNSLATLEFCTATEGSMKRAKDIHSFLQSAIDHIPADRVPNDQEVREFSGALDWFEREGNPFGAEFIQKLEAVQEKHTSMLERLRDKRRELDRKLSHAKIWSKVTSILFGAAVAAVCICTVLAAVIAAPPAAVVALASASSVSAMGEWVKSLWRKYAERIREQIELIKRMDKGIVVEIQELKSIRVMAIHLEKELSDIIADINFIGEHKDVTALRLSVQDITTRNASFVKELEDMLSHVDHVRDRILRARTAVLHFIEERRAYK